MILAQRRLWISINRAGLVAIAGCLGVTAAIAQTVPLPRPKPAVAAPGAPLAQVKQVKPTAPLAIASTSTTSAADLSVIKQAIDLAQRDRITDASNVAQQIGDPLGRKLVEWAILRADDMTLDVSRYASFAATNPGWPSVAQFRRKAEAVLWQDRADEIGILSYFANSKPLSAKGKLALARALLAQGNRAGAQQLVREAWREDALSRDLETQVTSEFGPLLTGGDHKARMDIRLYAEDEDAGLRAAQRLGGTQLAIAKARVAVINKAANAGKLLDEVPEDARRDAGYIFSRAQWLRRADRITEAAQWMLAAPRDASLIHDTDEWWIERRVLSRELLDAGDAKTAYAILRDAASPDKGGYKVEQHFTPGWVALRYLRDPASAAAHFARIPQASPHPAAQARAHYWQGRAAEALGRTQDARGHYERGMRYSTAYYGQLCRARLGRGEIVLHRVPQPSAEARNFISQLEVVRALDILYAINERDLVPTFVAGLADDADADVLAALAAITTRHQDARATLLIGRPALARGLPFDVYAYPIEGLPRYTASGPAVEPQVAYAIARQESGFHPRAVSRANALGLLQVTPATAKDVAKRNGLVFDQKRLLDDPAYNVQIGAAQLGHLIESYRGSYILAFVAYNAGPSRARDWIARYGDPRDPNVDPVDWVENIPFRETRDYVQRILENVQVYRVRFGASQKLMIEADLRRGSQVN